MSQTPSPQSRPQHPTRDEALLPKGQCRYLLLHPEVRGQRCACVGFSLHRSTPGSSCNCGHQAVYHLAAPTEESLADKEEIEALRTRIRQLEGLLEREIEAKNTLAVRVSALEEYNDRGKAEVDFEIKNAYRGIEGLWRHFGMLDKRTRSHDDRIDALMDAGHATQQDIRNLQTRLIEVDDASMLLEDRLDSITSMTRYDGIPTSPRINDETYSQRRSRRPRSSQRSNAPKGWTVHISLMPTASQPFPFEKDTMAYKRVLSRGLHRIVAVPGSDSHSFVQITSKEFAGLLKGRPWMPLVAKICDAKHLTGLPMLRQLPSSLIDSQLYDFEFLRKHCATLDLNGNILDLYIAMCDDTFAWSELRASPVFLGGLEACWDFDPFLDGPLLDEDGAAGREFEDMKPDDKQSAGDLLRAWSPPTARLKRTAPGASRTSSFGSADGEAKRSKIQHQCVGPSVERIDRRAEAV